MGVLGGLQEWLWGAWAWGCCRFDIDWGAAGLAFGGSLKVPKSLGMLPVCAPPGED